MKPKIIKDKTLKEWNEKYGDKHNLQKVSVAKANENPDLLNNKKWWLIEGTYYQVPKKKFLIPIFCLLGAGAIAAGVAIPLILIRKNNSSISVELTADTSQGVSIKESSVKKGQESTVTLEIPAGKEIDTLEIKVGGEPLTKNKDYTIDSNNKITIKSTAATGNITIKIIVKDIEVVYELNYDSTSKKYKSPNLTIKPNSTMCFIIKVDEDSSNIVMPEIFRIVDSSNNLVPISSVTSVTINDAAYTDYDLVEDNKKLDLNDLSNKSLTKTSKIKIVLTTANTEQLESVAWCDPIILTPYLEVVGNTSFKMSNYSGSKTWNGTLQWSTTKNNGYVDWNGEEILSAIGEGGKHYIYLRGTGNTCFYNSEYGPTTFDFAPVNPEDELKVSLNGDIRTLQNFEYLDQAKMDPCCFYSLFNGCTSLTTAPRLPATTLAAGCYASMFSGCTSLVSAPKLPAKNLPATQEEPMEYGCYQEMFQDCTSLTQTPALPATTLANNCYESMFQGCIGLKSIPEKLLPVAKLADYCYKEMFSGTGLESIPEKLLPATTLANGCYYYMFKDCESLTQAPALPAGKEEGGLEEGCYLGMFEGCSSLTAAPALPAKALKQQCYKFMFHNCTSLSDLPALPATELADFCYSEMFMGCKIKKIPNNYLPITELKKGCYCKMFYGCEGLLTIPNDLLPATALKENCYQQMFYDCKALPKAPNLPATTLTDHCYAQMFQGCKVLTTPPLFAGTETEHELTTNSATECCYKMFNGCLNLKVYNDGTTGTKFVKFTNISGKNAVKDMFTNTKEHSGEYTPDKNIAYSYN